MPRLRPGGRGACVRGDIRGEESRFDFVLSELINQIIAKAPYDTLRDFAPVANTALGEGSLVVVHPSLPVRNVQDLIALAKTRTLTYGSPGIGNTQHLISEMFNMQAGTKLVHVPYKGIAPVSSIVCEEFVRLPRARHSANRRAQKLHLLLGSFSIERRFL